MAQINDFMNKVLTKCDILLEGNVISKELLTRTFARFVSETSEKGDHNVGLVLHTGSPVFDTIAIAYAAISNMVLNELDSEEIINSLQVGDLVLYKAERYTFEGKGKPKGIKTDKEYIILAQGSGDIEYVPPKAWRKITPYNGQSTRLDGRGIKRKSKLRDEFYTSVLEIPAEDIPSVIDTSTVLLMSKIRADRIVKGLSFGFNGKTIPLLELVTASYFTENEELFYGGNTAKNEAVLKITGKASNVRRIIKRKDGNYHIGVIIMGSGTITKNYTELPEIINRKSLQYVFLLLHIDSDHGITLLNECEGARLFACTADFLQSYSSKPKVKNPLCEELARQATAVINHRSEPITLPGHLTWSRYKEFKRALLALKYSDFTDESKETFIIQAYSLMNLLLTSVFGLSLMEDLVEQGKINVVSPSKRHDDLCEIAAQFPTHLREKAQIVTDIIEELYIMSADRSEKGAKLCELLAKHHDKHIALIVPKAYYADIIVHTGMYDCMDNPEQLCIYTANKFDNTIVYDLIISVGDFAGTKFDAFRCRSAQQIITLLYEFESNIFKYKMKRAKETDKLLNQKSVTQILSVSGIEDIYYEGSATDSDVQDVELITAEIDDYVAHLNNLAAVRDVSFITGNASSLSEVVAVATFETGEKALFTKKYKAYVFERNGGEVNEVEVEKLSEGDFIVFTKHDDEARDVVDTVLNKLVVNKRVAEDIIDAYYKSKKWKTELIQYMNRTGLTEKKIAEIMIANGVSVTDTTIRRWLDVDARMVGPQKDSSIQQIALLIDDDEMFANYTDYFDACRLVKRIRNDIRKEIGRAIISKLQGNVPEAGSIMADIYDRIDSLAQILRVESITSVNHMVPSAAVNRPLYVKE